MKNLSVWKCVSPRAYKNVLNFGIQPLFIEMEFLKNKQPRVECESGRVFVRKSQKGCALSTPEKNWAKAQKSAIRHF